MIEKNMTFRMMNKALSIVALFLCLLIVWSGCTKGKPQGEGKVVPCQISVSSDRWKGEYFANKDLSGTPAMTRDDGTDLNFNWNRTSPSSQCGIGTENFSVRWTRDMVFKAGTHRFSMTVDDGGRLYVDGKLHIDKWLDQGASTYTVDIPLTAGSHHIVMEYYQHVGGTTAMLKVGTP